VRDILEGRESIDLVLLLLGPSQTLPDRVNDLILLGSPPITNTMPVHVR
jgi:hypothetical protein